MNLWALSSLGFLMQKCLNRFFHVKAVVTAYNQEKALVGALSVIVQLHPWIVYSTNLHGALQRYGKRQLRILLRRVLHLREDV